MKPIKFSVVRFTPDPEDIEPVNVALVLWQEPPLLLVDDKLQRLGCLATYVEPEMVRFYLDDFRQRLAASGTDQAGYSLPSQFLLMEPRELLAPLDPTTLELLQDKYLRKHQPPRSPDATRAKVQQKRVESALDVLLVEHLRVPPGDLMKRASPREFLTPAVFERLGGNGFHVARAIQGPHDLLLIDGVNLRQRVFSTVELRAQHIASAFYRVSKIRDDLQRIEGRTLRTASVVFGEASRKHAAKQEFLRAMLGSWSTYVLDPEHPAREFRQDLVRATGAIT